MPPKRASSKKPQSKAAASLTASAVDAKLQNNGDAEELLINVSSLKKGEIVEEPKAATKRSSGRAKNVANELETEAASAGNKKSVAKGRGKKKSNENEVIENEKTKAVAEEQIEAKSEANGEEDAVDEEQEVEAVTTKGKGRKKAEPKTKLKETKEVSKKEDTEVLEEPVEEEKVEEPKTSAKKGKAFTGRKKKQEPIVKTEEQPEGEENEDVNEEVEEKVIAPKKSSRSAKKEEAAAATSEAEPAKKKGRAAKKEKSAVEDEVEVTAAEEEEEAPKEEAKSEVKEKKPAKRGRTAAAKAVAEETTQADGETEEVLPKKRSRKAPSVEKEIVAEKPKRGSRGKKAAKVVDKFEEESAVDAQGKEELEQDDDMANGQVKQEPVEEVKESPKSIKKPETKSKGGRKRAAASTNKKSAEKTPDEDQVDNKEDEQQGLDNVDDDANGLDEDEADENESKPSKAKKKKTTDSSSATGPLKATNTKYNKEDFDLPPPPEGQTVEEPRFNLKISSWNVAGLRSWLKKEGLKYLEYEQPDIFCMQETKCTTDQLPEEVQRIPGYHPYWLCMPGGYAGVAIYSKIMPINVEYGIGNKEFDDCGRIITAEYEKFFLINVYVPNSGRKLVNLEARMRWEKLFQEFVKNLDARKPVVICGDMNVSHQEIDLANPKTNTRNAGFTKEERDKMSELLALGYIDTFRHLYPDRKGAYTFWTYMGNARSRNVGWRLDYFIVSERFIKKVVDNCIRTQCLGSDHCPITLFLKL